MKNGKELAKIMNFDNSEKGSPLPAFDVTKKGFDAFGDAIIQDRK